MLGILVGIPSIALVLVNVRYTTYIKEEDVQFIKNNAAFFAWTHQNDLGLFIEPNLESNFRAIDSINFSIVKSFASNIVNPNNISNKFVRKLRPSIFFDYIYEKQNYDGSYSDVGGLGNMISTHQAIKTLEIANNSYLNHKIQQNGTKNIVKYLNSSLKENGEGFKLISYLNESDIISTSCAIDLANTLNASFILIKSKR